MRTFALLAALALGTALTQQAVACDWNKEANSTPVIVADSCGNTGCATEQPTNEPVIRQEPAECTTNNCATPEPAALKVTCQTQGCATEEPETQAPTTLACATTNCP